MNTLHVRKGDTVLVLSGKDKGHQGKILACNPDKSRVQVEGTAAIVRHQKPRSAQNAGGRLQDTGFLHSSNVQIVCPSCSKPTRVAKKDIDGVKSRACKHCSASLDVAVKVDKKGKKTKEAPVKKLDKAVDKKADKKAEKAADKKADKKAEKTDKK